MGQRAVRSLPLRVSQGGIGLRAVPAENLLVGNAANAASLLALPPNAQQLRSNGTAWVAKPEGKILQVVNVTDTQTRSVTSGNVALFSFSLTFKKSNSKVLLMIAMASGRDSTISTWGRYSVRRVTTAPLFSGVIYYFGFPFAFFPYTTAAPLGLSTVDGLWLDSPGVAAGGSVSYTIFLENIQNTGSLLNNWNGLATSTVLLMEVSA